MTVAGLSSCIVRVSKLLGKHLRQLLDSEIGQPTTGSQIYVWIDACVGEISLRNGMKLSSSVYISVSQCECNWIRESVCTAGEISPSLLHSPLQPPSSSFSSPFSSSFSSPSHLQHWWECGGRYLRESHASSAVEYQSHHFVEARRVLEAVSDFYQRPFLVVLLRPDVVQFDCQLLDVGAKVFYCLQPVCEVTERRGLVRNMHSIRGGLRREGRTMPV